MSILFCMASIPQAQLNLVLLKLKQMYGDWPNTEPTSTQQI